MRVVAVTPYYPPWSRVGAWLATHEFLVALAARGHDVEVRTKIRRPVTLDGVAVMPVGETAARWLSAADVVVSHAGDMEHRVGEYAQARGIPSVVMIHGDARALRRPAADLIVANADSNRDKRWKDTIVCHPHTRIDAHRTKPGERITLVGCTIPKGWQTFSALVDRMPTHDFLGVKSDYGHQQRRKAANLKVIDRVNDMPRHVWSQTQILLMPSSTETWGMVGVEAMCSGIPVIAHPTPGLLESLGDAGIFVDRDDIDGWEQAIRRLDDHRVYVAAADRAARRAHDLCDGSTLDRFCDEIETRFG